MPQTFTAPAASRAGRRPLPSVLYALLLAAALLLPAAPAPAQGRPPEPTVSLDVKGRPLGEVLARIARATGSEFLIDPHWNQVPVTASFENAPLSVALKRVLSGLNHAIVYQPQNRVKIVIYETAPAAAGAQPALQPALSPTAPPPGRAPARPPQPGLPPAILPQPPDPMRNPPPEPADAQPEPEEETRPQG